MTGMVSIMTDLVCDVIGLVFSMSMDVVIICLQTFNSLLK